MKCWCGTMVESVPMLLGYYDAAGNEHIPSKCELGELRKLRDQIAEQRPVIAARRGSRDVVILDAMQHLVETIKRAQELKGLSG